jgi:ABC-2 type transport system permease protein
MIFLIYGGMVKYQAFQSSGEDAEKMLDAFPPAVKSAFGFNGLGVTKIDGYYAVFFLYFMLLCGIHAVMLGSVIISKEEKDKTADFLFVKPISRNKIINSKVIALLINIIIFNLVTLFTSIFFVNIYNKGESITNNIITLMLLLFILQLLFASLGMFIASISKNIKKATSISSIILLTAFILSIVIELYDKIDFLKYLTPFKYFPAATVMQNKNIEIQYFILSFALIIIFMSGTYIFTKLRDIHI